MLVFLFVENEVEMDKPVLNKVDLEEVIARKNPKLLKKLPRFVLNYIKKIIHQDEINHVLEVAGNKEGYEFLDQVLGMYLINYHILQQENLPEKGRYIIASNHPLGGLDGMVLIQAMHRHFGEVRFLVNDLLMNITPFRSLFIPINKHGALARDAARIIDEVMRSEMQILVFPAGLASRRIKGKVQDLEWKKSFISKAIEYQRDVIPVFFSGQNSGFFYRLSNLRKMIGIKTNFEMIYLPDEMFRQQNTTLKLVIGKPLPYTSFTGEKSHQQWAEYVREKVYGLKQVL